MGALGGSEGRPRTDACLSVLSKYRRGRAPDAVSMNTTILLVSVEGQSFGLPFFVRACLFRRGQTSMAGPAWLGEAKRLLVCPV